MFFINQIDELINDEQKAFRFYLIWFVLILLIGIIFALVTWLQQWFLNLLGPTLSSAFLLLLSKPPFGEMMKRREKIKTLKLLQRMALAAPPEGKEREEIEKLVLKSFRQMLKHYLMQDQEIEKLKLEALVAEKARHKKFNLYSVGMILLGLAISIWSVMEGNRASALRKQSEQTQQKVDSLEKRIAKANDLLTSQREKLINGHAVNGYLRAGLDYFYSKQYDLAINEYDAAIALDPENFVLYDLRGYSQLRSGKVNDAIQSLQKSVELQPTYAWGYYNLTLAYWSAGRREETLNALVKLVEVAPEFKARVLRDKQYADLLKVAEMKAVLR